MADRFFIGPYNASSGLRTDVKPFLIPDNAFSNLRNAYVFRERVRKRFGSRFIGNTQFSSRFRVKIGTADSSGNISTYVPRDGVSNVIVTPAVGQLFSIGDNCFTVTNLSVNPAPLLRSDGLPDTATFNTVTGQVIIQNSVSDTDVYYYPCLPGMALSSFESGFTNNEPTYGFDTRFAYFYISGGWERLGNDAAGGANVNASFWTGTNSQFFYTTTWVGSSPNDRLFFVTNFNESESLFMRYMDSSSDWYSFAPQVSSTPLYLIGARLLVVFKNRLIAFNTWENGSLSTVGASRYGSRARWSWIGDPTNASAFRQDLPGYGGGLDAPTMENIIGCEFLKDRLIVFFERSSWEFVYTGNQIQPFIWQKINTELGVESTFSVVPMDQVAIGVGNLGILECNANSVQRIDQSIPDTVFQIHNDNEGVERVYGIRDFFTELIYWSFPNSIRNSDFPYPNRVLVYNYKNSTWALNDDSFTCFGYFQNTEDILWSSQTVLWSSDVLWSGAPLQGRFRNIIAANQQGFTVIIDSDLPTNAYALYITNISHNSNEITIQCIDHNLALESYIMLDDIVGTDNITLLNNNIFKITEIVDKDNFKIFYNIEENGQVDIITGSYMGKGNIRRVSQIDISTKEYNFYASQGKNAGINKVDYMLQKTTVGLLNVNYYVSSSSSNLYNDSVVSGVLQGSGLISTSPYNLYPLENNASRLWRTNYIWANGEVIQLQITMNENTMLTRTDIDGDRFFAALEPFEMYSMCIHAMPTSSRFQ